MLVILKICFVFCVFIETIYGLSNINNSNICYLIDSTNIGDISIYSNWKCVDHIPVTDPCNSAVEWLGVYCSNDEIYEIAVGPSTFDPNLPLLTGTLPIELGRITSMKLFAVSFNLMYGSIPETYCNWIHLNALLLESNSFSRTIPSCIGFLSEMYSLQLATNRFTGAIPSTISNLSNIYYLNINNNLLSKSIPSDIWKMTGLSMINLHYNSLTGL